MFATGDATSLTIAVDWRSGRRSLIEGARPNRYYEIDEASAAPHASGTASDSVESFFADVSEQLNHIHAETDYLDHVRQPLLRHRLSQSGPGITWHDTDRDGDEDLYIPSGVGGKLAFLRNDGGRLTGRPIGLIEAPLDQTALLPFPNGNGGFSLLLGQSNYEAANPDEARSAASVLQLRQRIREPATVRPLVAEAVPGDESSIGHLALADYDGDGDLDLFAAGRVLPARYPLAPSSRLFKNEQGALVLDSANSAELSGIGMVSSAIFTDVDADGDPDLVLAMDWGSLRMLSNESGSYSDATAGSGLDVLLSKWNGVTAGDFDGDGMQDIVATSWGTNTRLEASQPHPLRLYYADFDGSGTMDILEARCESRLGDMVPIRGRMEVTGAIPFVGRQINSFGEYADATIHGVIGAALESAEVLETNGFEHMLFLNRGGRFESRALPAEAQLSPSFYAGVADFDGDGKEDLFLTQNFYPVEPEMPRYAAGRGLWLRGTGDGELLPFSGSQSGIHVYGDQRGAALSDFDGDGRVDLAVSQNGNETKLYHNVLAKPGLRVRLVGRAGNPDAIGATIRLVYDERMGPARELRSGSGYFSHDGPVQVMGVEVGMRAVWVRWPDGRESRTPVDASDLEVTIRSP
jgi:hypothetical protein